MGNFSITGKNNVLNIVLCEKLDKENSTEIRNKIYSIIDKNNNIDKVILDAQNLTYISSSGLRLLFLINIMFNNTIINNVKKDIYEILISASFDTFIEINKATKELSVADLDIIGEGACGKVYSIDNDKIVKVFHEGFVVPKIILEHDNAQKALKNGINTAICYDVVKVGNHVPDVNTFVHGDCNTGNLIYNDGELILIDMDAVSIGHPVFDVVGVYFCMKFLGQFLPDNFLEGITGFNNNQNTQMWNKFCEIYFNTKSEEIRLNYEQQLLPFAAFGAIQVASAISAEPKIRNLMWEELLNIYVDCCSGEEARRFKNQLIPFKDFDVIEPPAVLSPFLDEM